MKMYLFLVLFSLVTICSQIGPEESEQNWMPLSTKEKSARLRARLKDDPIARAEYLARGKQGSSAPGPVPNGQIRLYSMRFCPFAQRTRLVLHHKGIKHDTVNINLKDKPDWFLEKNPVGMVPTLENQNGQVIYESPITCDYLDEVYTEKKLLPSDPFEKAQQKMLLEHFSEIAPYFFRIFLLRKSGKDVSGLEGELKMKLCKFNETLVNKKTRFFGGDSITMIDYMMWPWFERIELVELMHGLDDTPALKKWMERMLEDPSVQATMFTTETYKAFYQSYKDGKPNYDYGL